MHPTEGWDVSWTRDAETTRLGYEDVPGHEMGRRPGLKDGRHLDGERGCALIGDGDVPGPGMGRRPGPGMERHLDGNEDAPSTRVENILTQDGDAPGLGMGKQLRQENEDVPGQGMGRRHGPEDGRCA